MKANCAIKRLNATIFILLFSVLILGCNDEDEGLTINDNGKDAGDNESDTGDVTSDDDDDDDNDYDNGLEGFICESGTGRMQTFYNKETGNVEVSEYPTGIEYCDDNTQIVHRTAVVECKFQPYLGDNCRLQAGGECAADSDCPEGEKCFCDIECGPEVVPPVHWGICQKPCLNDSECADNEICLCSGAGGVGSACLKAGCKTDNDCNGFMCARSIDEYGIDILGYFCHSAKDECQSDRDCREISIENDEAGRTCRYSEAEKRWRCLSILLDEIFEGCVVDDE